MRYAVERMPGHVQTQHLPFERELVLVLPLLVGHLDGERSKPGVGSISPAEQVELADRLGLLGTQHRVHGVGVHKEQPLAGMAERVEGTRLDQRLGDLLVAGRDVDLVEVVGEVGVLALLAAGIDQ